MGLSIDVTVRIYGPLNDFLPAHRRQVPWRRLIHAPTSRTRQHYDSFEMCSGCGRVYWKGSHWKRLKQIIDGAREEAERGAT